MEYVYIFKISYSKHPICNCKPGKYPFHLN